MTEASSRRHVAGTFLVLALAGSLVSVLHADAGAQSGESQAGDQPSLSAPPLPGGGENGPASNEGAKTGREPGPGGASPEAGSALGLYPDELDFSRPGQRAKVLDQLYGALARAKTDTDGRAIGEAIEEIWRMSGSDTIDLLLSRADSFVKLSDLDMAAQVLDSVVELAPDDAEGWYQRAMVHVMQNDYTHALADLKRALEIDPQHYQALNDLGVVLIQMGDKKGALEAFRNALKVNPFFDSAKQRVEELSRDVEGQDI
jgi:hypothetical protein